VTKSLTPTEYCHRTGDRCRSKSVSVLLASGCGLAEVSHRDPLREEAIEYRPLKA